jgi:hypothetical protein
VSIAGHAMPQYGLGEFAFKPGEVIDLDETLAGHWQASGIVEELPDDVGDVDDVEADTEAEQPAKQPRRRAAKGKGR